MFIDFKTKAIDPVINAIRNNEAALRSLYQFGKAVLEPFLRVTLLNAIEGISNVAQGIVQAVSFALRALEPIINAAISGINAVIRAKNLLLGGNTATIASINFGSAGGGGTIGNFQMSTGSSLGGGNAALAAVIAGLGTSIAGLTGGGGTKSGGGGGGGGSTKAQLKALSKIESDFAELQRLVEILSGQPVPTVAPMGAVSRGEYSGGVTVNVNAPSVIDETGFTRAVVDALNSVERRQGGGASALVGL